MTTRTNHSPWLSILWILCLAIPLVFLLTASGGGMHSMLWMWIILLLCFYMIASMAVASRTSSRTDQEVMVDDGVRMIPDGEQPPAIASVMDGYLVQLSPLGFAGWLGLFITAFNLMPIGQLDGGHMARAMFGRRVGETIGSVAMWSLFLLAIFVWPGLLFFALFIFFITGRGTPPLNDITPISSGRQWVGYATFVILAMILIPLPHKFWQAADIYCPYL